MFLCDACIPQFVRDEDLLLTQKMTIRSFRECEGCLEVTGVLDVRRLSMKALTRKVADEVGVDKVTYLDENMKQELEEMSAMREEALYRIARTYVADHQNLLPGESPEDRVEYLIDVVTRDIQREQGEEDGTS